MGFLFVLFFLLHRLEHPQQATWTKLNTGSSPSSQTIFQSIAQILQSAFNLNNLHLLNKRFHNALANLHSHILLLEHIQKWQEFLLEVQIHKQVKLVIFTNTLKE